MYAKKKKPVKEDKAPEFPAKSKGIDLPSIRTKEEQEDLKELRIIWEREYTRYLLRKNNLAAKLAAKGRPTSTSERYQELDKRVKHFWQKLRDTRPVYSPL